MLSSSYFVHQILRDGVTATYDNVIEIGAAVDELLGTYSCNVLNSAGLSNVAILNVQGEAYTLNSKFYFLLLCCVRHFVTGIQITGNEVPLSLGSSARFICSSDLDIIAAEWLFDGRVIVQSEANQANLYIPAVNDSLHNRQYLCRIITPYGVQERNATIIVSGIFYIFFKT